MLILVVFASTGCAAKACLMHGNENLLDALRHTLARHKFKRFLSISMNNQWDVHDAPRVENRSSANRPPQFELELGIYVRYVFWWIRVVVVLVFFCHLPHGIHIAGAGWWYMDVKASACEVPGTNGLVVVGLPERYLLLWDTLNPKP